MEVTVYVPAPGSSVERTVIDGAAIVGSPEGDRIMIDYEGNAYQQFGTFAEMLMHAAGRHAERYPTTARMWVEPEQLVRVGTYDYDRKDLDVDDPDALLAAWGERGVRGRVA